MVEITAEEFKQLSDYIRNNYGINLKEGKKSLVTARLHKVLEQRGMKTFTEYFDYIVSDKTGTAAVSLINGISTNYSYFMRESKHFYYLRDTVLPYFEKTITDYDFRIWSAGCATGEEAYTLAFILDEYFKEKGMWDKKLLATDVSERALEVARKGIYEKEHMSTLPGVWKLNYFKQVDRDSYEVIDRIKQEVLFRHFNLVKDSYLFRKPFHVIFLRNVMIYFDDETRFQILEQLYEATAPGGYLFLGHSESLVRGNTKYKYVMPAVYRRI